MRPLEGERTNAEAPYESEDRARSLCDAVNLSKQEETRPLERSGGDGECAGGRCEVGQPVVGYRLLERRAPSRLYRSRRQSRSVSGRKATAARYGASAIWSGRCDCATVGPLPRRSRDLLMAESRLSSS